MRVFATLGPVGSNHHLVTQKYIDFHQIEDAQIELITDFNDALDLLLTGKVQHIVQAAVHPATAMTVAKHRNKVFVIDTFIAPSKPLAVLTRIDVSQPRSLGLPGGLPGGGVRQQIATQHYVDTSRWEKLVPEVSIATVAQGLIEGKYDSGITALELAEQHPRRFRVDEVIGTVDDAWLVYGTERTCTGDILAWPDSPAASLFARRR